MADTKSPQYRKLMALLRTSGIDHKDDRLYFAQKVLGYPVETYTELEDEEVAKILNALIGWEAAQELRLYNGATQCESAMILRWMMNPDILTLSDYSVLPNAQSRRKFMDKANFDIDEKNYAINKDGLDDVLEKALVQLSTSKPTRLTTTDGRWQDFRVIPAPTVSMGLAIGIGGIPRGKIIHLWGQKHAGKSMLSYSIIAEAQKKGIPCILIDAEAAATGDFLDSIGVDVEELKVIRPRNLEELCTILRRLANSGYLIVVDSIAAAESAAELERNLSKEHAKVGGNARIWIQTLSTMRADMVEHGTTLILINQVRAKLDKGMYEEGDKPWGSEGIQHHVDLSLKVSKVTEKNNTLKNSNYRVSRLRFDKNRFSGDASTIDLVFRPGNPYNKKIDLIRSCGEPLYKGSEVTFGEMADNVIRNNSAADDNGNLISKNSRWAIRIDPLMMSAIQIDDPDFCDVDITPLEEWDQITVTDVDKENSTYYTIPRVGEIVAANWLKQHPTARYVLEERLLNGLNNKKKYMEEEQ